jgi:hypothetical protein
VEWLVTQQRFQRRKRIKRNQHKKATTKSKADYRPGGMYSTGRAIPPSPGTKYTGGSKKESNMKKAQERNRTTSAKPSKGPSRNTNKKYR